MKRIMEHKTFVIASSDVNYEAFCRHNEKQPYREWRRAKHYDDFRGRRGIRVIRLHAGMMPGWHAWAADDELLAQGVIGEIIDADSCLTDIAELAR